MVALLTSGAGHAAAIRPSSPISIFPTLPSSSADWTALQPGGNLRAPNSRGAVKEQE